MGGLLYNVHDYWPKWMVIWGSCDENMILLAYENFGNISSLIDLNRNFDQRLAIRLLNKTLEDSRSGLEPFLNEWIHAGLQDSALLSKDQKILISFCDRRSSSQKLSITEAISRSNFFCESLEKISYLGTLKTFKSFLSVDANPQQRLFKHAVCYILLWIIKCAI